jgi:hypothetical protein
LAVNLEAPGRTKLYEEGVMFQFNRDLPLLVLSNIQQLAKKALVNIGVLTEDDDGDWTEGLFWAVQPGGREILDKVESRFGLRKEKLAASREVVRQYGNTLSSCVVLVLDEIRLSRGCTRQGRASSGGCSSPLGLASPSRPSSSARCPTKQACNVMILFVFRSQIRYNASIYCDAVGMFVPHNM